LILSRMGSSHSEQIEKLLKRAIALDPTLAAAHLQLAEQYAQQGLYASAIPEYKTALTLKRTLREAHYRLALAYKRTGQLEKSMLEMQKFRSSARENSAGQNAAASDTSLAQFISAMRTPAGRFKPDTRCLPSTRRSTAARM
jgi:tetratricopeptide (TPR) repeat protein